MMECIIKSYNAFEVFGIYEIVSADRGRTFKDISAFINKYVENGDYDRMNDLLGRPRGTYVHTAQYDHGENAFKYMMCCHAPQNINISEQYTKLKVPALTWAIFAADEKDMRDTWQRVYSEWLPASGYEQAAGPTFEMYYGMFGHSRSHCEIWIPAKKTE